MELLLSLLRHNPNASFVFTHYLFWLFYGIVLFGNALLYKRSVLRNAFLFVASIFFYYKAGGYYFFLLLFSTLVDYSIGIGMGTASKQGLRKLLLTLSLFVNLGLLAYFKYSYFIADLLQQTTGIQLHVANYFSVFTNALFNANLDVEHILLPVGISFFTFQTISYSVDVYRKRIEPVKNILDFGFYVSFFPQLVAGPIVRAWEFIPQLHKKYVLSEKRFWLAVWLIMGGLFKKMVISDYLSVNLVDRVFDAPMMYSGVELLMAAYAYTMQIYCDFSGYTDIAIGVALILGFKLPDNFNLPYVATSVTDFWRRWHISLSSWLRDYLYIPLGGNRRGLVRTGINLMITMLLGGLWHGAGWLFVIWGALHGLALLFEKLIFAGIKNTRFKIPGFIGFLFTFHFIVGTWIVFRSPDVETLQLFFIRLLSAFSIYDMAKLFNSYSGVLLILFLGYMIHWLPSELERLLKWKLVKANIIVKILAVVIFGVIIYQFSLLDIKPFIYFRF
ncbi:D-alanyl-lipoteichoic acid acyltransferase DltB, MBOAT superfamily [Saccharicrinis carchari]|uniref:D-alanyl-lipoteichoic acid acyltransferase DltB, MBOAT superfamily n=1 Tax=Saccharicrinis carchari TaxID=1168039 RepID=A0A521BX14_SACCC|nr:MBOAT family O-acyltransferase [Saccharicrinis carchari]SMO51734.1 D-alanyl-lipoteichoic acid acyltransferase DltB, MBOAT superfamily [Saccharicrinis carchari]